MKKNKPHDKNQRIEQLEQENALYRKILENLPVGIQVFDNNGASFFVNKKQSELLGLHHPQAGVGQFNVLTDPYSVQTGAAQIYENVYRGNTHEHTYEYNLGMEQNMQQTQRETRIFQEKIIPLPNNLNQTEYVLAVLQDVSKHQQLQKQLEETQHRFELALDATHDGIWDWNLITNEIYFSANWKKMLGYQNNELPNVFSVWEKLTHPNDVKKSWEMLNKHINGKLPRFEMELRMKHKNGQWVDILSRAQAYFDQNHTAHRVVGTHVDINRQKQLEKQLIIEKEKAQQFADEISTINEELNQANQEYLAINEELRQTNELLYETNERLLVSETKFKTVFDIIDIGLTITDEQGHIIDCNRASEKILGITKQEHLTRLYDGKEWNIVRPDQTPMPPNEFASVRALTENKPVLNIEMGINKPQQITWMSVSATPIQLENYGVLVAYIDITDRINAERERIVFNRNFEAFLNQTSDFIYFKDINSRFLFCSQTLADITGHQHWKQMIGKHDFDVFPPNIAQIYNQEEVSVFNEGKPLLDKINPYFDKHGNKRFIATNKWPLFDDNKKVVGIFGISSDITQRLEAQQKLKDNEKKLMELNATKDKFFSIIAHDLRSPYSAILGFSELAVKSVLKKDIEKLDQFCKLIHQSAKQSFNLLNNLLEWSRIQTGKIEFNPDPLPLKALVIRTLDFLNANIKEKNIQVTLHIDEHIELFADKFMIETVLRNLISNSVKFTPSGGQISVQASLHSDRVQVTIKDSGIGISSSDIEKLFKIESNFSMPGTNNEKGTGLGLILCKEFIEKHNGTIWVESQLSEWTTFNFTIANQP